MFKHEVENSNINTQQLFELFGGHYSYLGNQIIAHKLAPLLKLLKEKKYKDAHKNLDSFIKLKPDYKKIQDNLKIRDFVTQPFSYQSKNFLGDPVNTNIGLDLISENDRLLIEKAKEAIKTARNFIKTGNIRPALIHYKKALEYTPQWVEVMNEYAWVISTSGQAVNNTQDAIALAGLACEASKNTNPLHLDTLAAAYARAGKYKDALGIAQIALKRAIVQKIPELEKSIKKRIEVYKSNNYYTGKR
jgi:tetratricopeptide (TPR) repeat protein